MSRNKSPGLIRSARYLLEYAGALSACRIIGIMPLGLLREISSLAGKFIIAIPATRRLIMANLKVAFPEKEDCEIRRLATENAKNTVLAILEFLWFSQKPDKLAENFDHTEETYVAFARKSQAEGKGLIWVTPHLGNWELAGFQFRNRTQIPFAVVVRPQNNPYLDRIVSRGRQSVGNRIIGDKGAVRGMIKALRDGCFIATLIDQNTRARDGGIFVDFFGLPASTSRAPAFFARKLDVNIAVAGCVRIGAGKYQMFCELLPKKPSEYSGEDEIIQELMRINERLIRKYPEQYLWLYKRWHYIPENIPPETKSRFPFYSVQVTRKFYDRNAGRDEKQQEP